jgi:hypothetical protein
VDDRPRLARGRDDAAALRHSARRHEPARGTGDQRALQRGVPLGGRNVDALRRGIGAGRRGRRPRAGRGSAFALDGPGRPSEGRACGGRPFAEARPAVATAQEGTMQATDDGPRMPEGRPAPDGMAEPAPPLDPAALSPRKRVVWSFYKQMWDHADTSLIPAIFHPDFAFRGSLGPVLRGHEEFAGYVRWVTSCLEGYTSDILSMAEDGDTVAARLRFHGVHRREMFGVPPTGRHVWWHGAPFFRFDGDRVRDLWVLGDVHGLIGRLRG